MKNQDELKEFFKDRFSNYSPEVPASSWNAIRTELKSNPVSPSSANQSNWWSNLGISSKIALSSAGALILSSTIYLGTEFSQMGPSAASNPQVQKTISSVTPKETGFQEKKSVAHSAKPKHDDITNIDPIEPSITENVSKANNPSSPIQTEQVTQNLEEPESIMDNTDSKITETPQITSQLPSKDIEQLVSYQPKIIAQLNEEAENTFTFYGVENLAQVKWQFGDGSESSEFTPTHQYQKPGEYIATMLGVTENGNSVMDKTKVVVKAEEKKIAANFQISVPQVFTPDGDGTNDLLKIEHKNIVQANFTVYNKAGLLVYTSNDLNKPWDGRSMNGEQLIEATYFYIIKFTDNQGLTHVDKGYISIFK